MRQLSIKLSEQGIEPANGGLILAIGTLSEPSSDRDSINDGVEILCTLVYNGIVAKYISSVPG